MNSLPISSQTLIRYYTRLAKELNKKLSIVTPNGDEINYITVIVNKKAKEFKDNLQSINSEIDKFIRETK